MVDHCNDLNQAEKNLVSHSSMVWQGPAFSFYRLPVAQLDTIALIGQKAFETEMIPLREGKADTTTVLYFNGFDTNQTETTFFGPGAFTGEIGEWNHLLDLNIKNGLPGDSCEILFWAKGYEKDLFARTIIEFVQKDGDQTMDYKFDQFQHFYTSLIEDWMRIRIPFVLKTSNDRVMLSVRNKDLKHFRLLVDDLLIRKKL